jgi:hypothetical protein
MRLLTVLPPSSLLLALTHALGHSPPRVSLSPSCPWVHDTPSSLLSIQSIPSIPSPSHTSRCRVAESLTDPASSSQCQSQLLRLPSRNTSRDDRLLSSFSRDARYPYLDLSFIAYLSSLPIHAKFDPTSKDGMGDKRILRLAVDRVGLGETARRVKRAMQFGSRSAKVGGAGKGPRAGQRAVE